MSEEPRGIIAMARVPEIYPASETASYVALLERAAMDPSFDLQRLERLIELKDKALADAARREFNKAMVEVQALLPQVVKDAENTQTSSKYATLEAIGAAIDPIITSHGFFQSFGSDTSPLPNCYRVVCRTGHVGGHEQIDMLDVPIDIAGIKGTQNKTPTHALASTLSYGRRLSVMMVFNVKSRKAMPDDDGNAAGDARAPETLTEEQVGELQAMIDSTGADKAAFLRYIKVESLADIYADSFQKAVDLLKRKGERR